MIKRVIITNYLGESLELDLRAPEKSGLYIRSITGLGPGKANINTTQLTSIDGSVFNSARALERNIVMTLGFMEVPGLVDTIEDARQLTYKYFPKKKELEFFIETDNRKLYAYGYVESNEPDIFSDKESTIISIICPDPLFYSALNSSETFNGIDYEFEFPFENNTVGQTVTFIPGISSSRQRIVNTLPASGSKTITYFVPVDGMDGYFDEYVWLPIRNEFQLLGRSRHCLPDIEMGSIEIMTERTIYYDGDAETGVLINIHAIGSATNVTIYNTGTREMMRINTDKLAALTGAGIVAGDEIEICTVKGNKYAKLLRGGVITNILNAIDRPADWFQLAQGDNVFTYLADTGSSYLQFTIANKTAFEGV